MSIRFVYFDLGNVLLNFSVQRLLHQVSGVVEKSEEEVRAVLFGDKKYYAFENGDMTIKEYFELIRFEFNTNFKKDDFVAATSDIFWVNDSILPLVRHLSKSLFPRGVLSNTNPIHWQYVQMAFPCIWELFPQHQIASFAVNCLKPFPDIYEVALNEARKEIVQIKPEEILLIDDLEENVNGAKAFGFHAVQYLDVNQLVADFKKYKLPLSDKI
ncbi:MAG: HAD family phosphatase [Planctomycetia bacterium]|nr:HAD family phosphatase [Planctomycetia bacterium]